MSAADLHVRSGMICDVIRASDELWSNPALYRASDELWSNAALYLRQSNRRDSVGVGWIRMDSVEIPTLQDTGQETEVYP